jgi:hypothetical protein
MFGDGRAMTVDRWVSYTKLGKLIIAEPELATTKDNVGGENEAITSSKRFRRVEWDREKGI